MSRVNADPREIRRFQSNLRQFNQQLDSITKRLQGQLRTLGSAWQDTEYRKFEAEINEIIRALNRYLSQSEQYLRYLDKKAESLERYLGQR